MRRREARAQQPSRAHLADASPTAPRISREFADEMSYCLGCLACQTACPAGVDYAVPLPERPAQAARFQSRARKFWRAITLRFLFKRPRALRAAARALRLYQRSGLEGLVRRSGAIGLLPASLRRIEPQAPRVAAVFSNGLIAALEQPASAASTRWRC
jgi:glycolate oxidase iron-sulfur subunit